VQLASNLTKGIDSCKPQVFGKKVNVTFFKCLGLFSIYRFPSSYRFPSRFAHSPVWMKLAQ